MTLYIVWFWVTDSDSFGKINVLINNASKQSICKDFADIDLDVVEESFHTNILQMFAITKYALPHMSRGDRWVWSFVFHLLLQLMRH